MNAVEITAGLFAAIALVAVTYLLAQLQARLRFERWKTEYRDSISRDAIKGSQAAVAGKVFERLAPYLPGFGYNPRDVRFVGDPVDFIVFDGLSEDQCHRIVFVEVKTGASSLSSRERKVRDAIKAKRIEWQELRLDPGAQTQDRGPSRGQDARDRQRHAVRRPDSPIDAAAILKGVRGMVRALLSPAPRG